MRLFDLSWLFLLWLNPNASLQQNEIKCQLTLPPLRGTRYEPAYRSLFSPGEKIRVTCGEGYWILNTQTTSTETTCKNDRDWTIRPVCEEVTCSHPQALYLDHWGDSGQQQRLGDTVTYRCGSDYRSTDGAPWATCTRDGWEPNPLCQAAYGCKRPPSISNGDIKTSAKYHYQHKERVEYICQQYYTMEGGPFKTCINGEWTAEIRCHQNCRVPEVPASLRIATDVTGNQIRKGQHLTFACQDSSHVIKGNATIECLENGQWSNPLPTCEAALGCWRPPSLSDGDIKTSTKYQYQHNERVEYICQQYYTMEGGPFKTCINGEWTGEIRCLPAKDCRRSPPPLSHGQAKPGTRYPYRHNDKVEYVCDTDYGMEGGPFKTCVDGDWVGEMRCRLAHGCGRPPPLSDGDTKSRPKYQYQHNDKVEYICQPYYVMEGGPFKTCKDGEWTGEIRCLRPCTVNRDDMNRHNIQFKHRRDDKLYSEHNDVIVFECKRGYRHDGAVGMRQTCEHGVIHLPTCQ
uniref:Sushi domain-containing protein n=1 Tax=Oreochromis aureus TaxID=47969 RepID=A0A668VH33_OREAU